MIYLLIIYIGLNLISVLANIIINIIIYKEIAFSNNFEIDFYNMKQ
jgi:hypothetical protein